MEEVELAAFGTCTRLIPAVIHGAEGHGKVDVEHGGDTGIIRLSIFCRIKLDANAWSFCGISLNNFGLAT